MHMGTSHKHTEWKYKENEKTKFKILNFEIKNQKMIKDNKVVFLYVFSRALQRESLCWS